MIIFHQVQHCAAPLSAGEEELRPYIEEELIQTVAPKNASATEMNLSYDGDAVFRFKSGKSVTELTIQWEQ